MKNSPLVFTVCFAFFLGITYCFPPLEGFQKAEWKGTIEKENEITIIKNPKEPLYGEIKFNLVQDLSLGNIDDNNYSFKRIGNIQVDKNGFLYVLDSDNFRIQVFDKKGKYLQTIGIQGEKSGEFENPQHILVDETTGSIYVKDRRRSIDTFDLYGYHLWTTRLDRNIEIREYNVDEDGSIIGALKIDSESGVADTISKIDRNGEVLAHYVEHPNIKVKEKVRGSDYDTYYGFDIYLARLDYKTLVFGWALEYKLNIIDNYGRSVLIFEKDIGDVHSDPNEISKIIKLDNYNKFTKFYSILSDDKGRIYIQTNKTKGAEAERVIDLFSKDGYYLYKTTLPKQTQVIKNGYLYAVVKEGQLLVKRYKIKNWDQIKTGISS